MFSPKEAGQSGTAIPASSLVTNPPMAIITILATKVDAPSQRNPSPLEEISTSNF